MKFSCLQENLSKGLQAVSRAVPVKGSLPILSNILLSAQNGQLKLSATNLETAITTFVPCSVEEEGALTVPAKLLKDFVTTLSPGVLNAHTQGDALHISSSNTKSKFIGVSATEYPELPVFPESGNFVEIDPMVLQDAVSHVAFASGTDDSRPVFTGIFIQYKDKTLVFASTDGFRLSEKMISLESGPSTSFSVVIPARTLAEVSKVFASSGEPVSFVLNESENLVLFRSADTTIATRILEGTYPDYKKIIPSEKSLYATFLSEEFLEAVKLTNIFAKEGNFALKLRFDPDGFIRISSVSEETGEHESQIQAEIEGELFEVAFNSKYLLDYLNNVKAERILFTTKGNVSPCMLKPEKVEDFLHIIMPMQL